MDALYRYIIEASAAGTIVKQTAVEIIRLLKQGENREYEDIAIIGMVGKFPMSDNIEEFWSNMVNYIDCVGDFPQNRKEDIRFFYESLNSGTDFFLGNYLSHIDEFDNEFFGLSSNEANIMSPNQRILLQLVWHVLEDAGYINSNLIGSDTGVFLGYSTDFNEKYKSIIKKANIPDDSFLTMVNIESFINGRICHCLDLKGPSMLINTACSSSLTAIHLACQALLNRECEMAVAGGMNINIAPIDNGSYYAVQSSDWRTKTFDDSSDGTSIGEGGGVVLLKKLKAAIKDRDNIHAVIKGSHINQDGNSIGLTAPDSKAQRDVLLTAWKRAGINPETMSYLEAHGTGTKLGDPVEIEGIRMAFGKHTDMKQFCAIGSVKSNIGHLDYAAGIAGVIKAVLALENKQIPPTLSFLRPNRKISFVESPVYVNDKLRDWKANTHPRRCGVSSFGLSGTNCHVVLEEAPADKEFIEVLEPTAHIFTLTARNPDSLRELLESYIRLLKGKTGLTLINICFTANTGRAHFNYRIAVICRSLDDLIKKLERIRNLPDTQQHEKEVYYGANNNSNDNLIMSIRGEPLDEEIRRINRLAYEKVADLAKADKTVHESLLNDICKLYISGAGIPWNEIYMEQCAKRICLPMYPFRKTRCWVDLPTPPEKHCKTSYYTIKWKKTDIGSSRRIETGSFVIFKDEKGIWENIYQKLSSHNMKVILIETGDKYEKLSENRYIVGKNQDDYYALIKELRNNKITHIIHLFTLMKDYEANKIEDLDNALYKGIYSLFFISKAFVNSDVKNNVEIVLVSENVNEITKNENIIYPENSAFFGMGRAISSEIPFLKCTCIDIDTSTYADMILEEIGVQDGHSQVAYRNGERYIAEFTEIDISKVGSTDIAIRENGVYIITGGTGGIGLELAKYISSKNKVNICLLSRSGFPSKKEWDGILEDGKNTRLCSGILKIKEIEMSGSDVQIYSVDVSDMSGVINTVEKIKLKYGKVDGIIHCAGISGQGPISDISTGLLQDVLSPKIHGTWVLDRVTKKENLDFFISFSSVASVFGFPNQASYVAANAYLDSYASTSRFKRTHAVTVNWPAWKEVGLAKESNTNSDGVFKALSTSNAISAFDRVFNKNLRKVIIGELNYANEVIYMESRLPFDISRDIKESAQLNKKSQVINKKNETKPKQIILKGCNAQTGCTKAEMIIASVWGILLGIEEVDMDDNFYRLGGNSLLSVKFEIIMEDMGIPVKYYELENNPTIRKLAVHIKSTYGHMVENCTFESNVQLDPKHLKYEYNNEIEDANDKGHIKRVFGNIEPFNDIFFKSCFYNSLFPIILGFERSIMQFLVNDIISYKYLNVNDKVAFDINYSPVSNLDQLLYDLGIGYKGKFCSTDVINNIESAISSRKPVILWVDCYFESQRKDMYYKKHWPHTLLVYGYDDYLRKFNVVEQKSWDSLSYEECFITYSELINSYEGYIENFMRNNKDYSYHEFFSLESGQGVNVGDLDDRYIRRWADAICDNSEIQYMNLLNIKSFLDDLQNIISDECFFNNSEKQILDIMNNINNIKAVDQYRAKYLFPKNLDLLDTLGALTTYWRNIRAVIVKYSHSKEYDQKTFMQLSADIKKLYILEEKYLNDLSCILKIHD